MCLLSTLITFQRLVRRTFGQADENFPGPYQRLTEEDLNTVSHAQSLRSFEAAEDAEERQHCLTQRSQSSQRSARSCDCCLEWLRGPFQANPVRLRRKGIRTGILPSHEVADGFDFPASHRKIKKEFTFRLLLNSSLCELCGLEGAERLGVR
jgi:hypothetical protein